MNEDTVPIFYVGHHDRKRDYPVDDDALQHAHSLNYDMLTAPITTNAFYTRVSSIISKYISSIDPDSSHDQAFPVLGSLSCSDKGKPETHIRPGSAVNQAILVASSWIDLASFDPLIADISRQVLSLEIQYAAFCGASNIVIRGPRLGRLSQNGLSQYARAIQDSLSQGLFVQLHISLPMGSQPDVEESIFDLASHARQNCKQEAPKDSPQEDAFESWDAWNSIRSICTYSARLSVALTIPQDLPPLTLQSRWFSEPLRILEFPSSTFTKSQRGGVMLPHLHRQILYRYMRRTIAPWILLSDVGDLPGLSSTTRSNKSASKGKEIPADPTPAQASKQSENVDELPPYTSHLVHIRQLQDRQPPKDAIERFGSGYQDYLQSPLQPLADNLESMTYEVFEKDPIKYEWYEKAIAAALRDWKDQKKSTSGRDGSVTIAIVGAGRGPLVTRALQASASTGVPIDVWAVEKNQNAFVLLQRYFYEKWDQRVNLTRSDMRSWAGPFYYSQATDGQPASRVHYSVDILVSELLGSFADNELSPECLDGVQHLLSPKHGISIPSSYTAHLTPIAAPKLHADILARTASGEKDATQIPYVVMLHGIDFLSTRLPPRHPDRARNPAVATPRPQPVPVVAKAWEFHHPNAAAVAARPDAAAHGNEHNRRFARMDFKCRDRGVCHGLGGYFETVLYDPDVANPSKSKATSPEEQALSRALKAASKIIKQSKVELSTNPLTMEEKSRDMISWFPIYFTLKTPLYFPDNSLLSVSMWRQTDGRKVWYEWIVENSLVLGSGSDQRHVRLGASELHSSVNTGCLM